jgi:hypothetical protein
LKIETICQREKTEGERNKEMFLKIETICQREKTEGERKKKWKKKMNMVE